MVRQLTDFPSRSLRLCGSKAFFRLKEPAGYATIIFLCLALVAAILGVYLQVGNQPFLAYFDRIDCVTNNPHIEGGLTGRNIIWAFTSFDAFNWHPMTWLSHMAVAQFAGMSPRAHHLTNVVIHAASSVLLFLLLLRLTGAMWQSWFVAALFGLHPMHVESVAWVAERKDVLSALFGFLALFFYAGYADGKPRPVPYALAFTCFLLGLMSKSMLVTLPVVMLLLDFWPLDRFRPAAGEGKWPARAAALFREKIPFFAVSLAVAVVTIQAQRQGGALKDFYQRPLGQRIENALVSYARYVFKAVWPRDLAFLYPYPASFPFWQVAGSLFLLILLSLGAVRFRRQLPFLAVGWFWFLITLAPVIGLIQVGDQSMADRYSYLPSIGLFIIAAWGVPELLSFQFQIKAASVLARLRLPDVLPVRLRRLDPRRLEVILDLKPESGLRYRTAILALLASVVVVASAALTWKQAGFWRDNITLYRRTLEVTTGNYSIMNKLGLALAEKGDLDGAIGEYHDALEIRPNDVQTHNNLGLALAGKGDHGAAIREYLAALRINPGNPEVHCNLGASLADTGNLDAAIGEYRESLRIKPNITEALNNLGVALAGKGDQDEAILTFRKLLRINPFITDAHYNLGVLLSKKGDADGAILEYREALRLSPDDKEFRNTLQNALARQKLPGASVK